MLDMLSHPRRPQSGHLMCYLNRTYHVLPTAANRLVDASVCSAYHFTLTQTRWASRTRPSGRAVISMDKKKLDYFRKRLESRQQDLRRMVSRTQQDGRAADEDTAQDIADRAASS